VSPWQQSLIVEHAAPEAPHVGETAHRASEHVSPWQQGAEALQDAPAEPHAAAQTKPEHLSPEQHAGVAGPHACPCARHAAATWQLPAELHSWPAQQSAVERQPAPVAPHIGAGDPHAIRLAKNATATTDETRPRRIAPSVQ
jgi:hypothetical protein